MFDLTVGEVKKFEQLPDDKWVLGRLVKREVVRWVESDHKFLTSTDEVLMKLMRKLEATDDEIEQKLIRNELKAYQFSFTFKILEDKKFSGFVVKARSSIYLCFNNTDGEREPNKLAKLYLGAGGLEAKKGEKMNIDSIVGNYVKMKVESNRNQQTKKVYQSVVEVGQLTTEELTRAKVNEVEIMKIEKALEEAEKKSLSASLSSGNLTQAPVLENKPANDKEIPF